MGQEITLKRFLLEHEHEQHKTIPADTKTLVPVRSKMQLYAVRNACTLILLSAAFVITWVLIMLGAYGVIGR